MLLLQLYLLLLPYSMPLETSTTHDKTVIDIVLKIYNLKNETFTNAWDDANDRAYKYSLIYYTDWACYVVNPLQRFINQFPVVLVYDTVGITIYKTSSRIDSIPFHMEQNISLGEDNGSYDYNYPYAKCSNYEEASKVIPNLDINAWMAMIVHEFFHVYQFQHIDFRAKTVKSGSIYPSSGDSLQNYYNHYPWYKQAVDSENACLLSALKSESRMEIDSLINQFLRIRKNRRLQISRQLGLDIDVIENELEAFEGTARYMEATALRISFETLNKDRSEKYTEPGWLYKTTVSDRYYYTTGYNAAKLLDKLALTYKSNCFTYGLSIQDLLAGRR